MIQCFEQIGWLNDSTQKRHWQSLLPTTGVKMKPAETVTEKTSVWYAQIQINGVARSLKKKIGGLKITVVCRCLNSIQFRSSSVIRIKQVWCRWNCEACGGLFRKGSWRGLQPWHIRKHIKDTHEVRKKAEWLAHVGTFYFTLQGALEVQQMCSEAWLCKHQNVELLYR